MNTPFDPYAAPVAAIQTQFVAGDEWSVPGIGTLAIEPRKRFTFNLGFVTLNGRRCKIGWMGKFDGVLLDGTEKRMRLTDNLLSRTLVVDGVKHPVGPTIPASNYVYLLVGFVAAAWIGMAMGLAFLRAKRDALGAAPDSLLALHYDKTRKWFIGVCIVVGALRFGSVVVVLLESSGK